MVFNAEPAISNTQSTEELEYLKSEAIIKGLHAGDVPFLAYSVPKKRKREENTAEEVEYQWIQEFEFQRMNEEDSYFFKFAKDKVEYDKIRVRINLKKLKSKDIDFPRPSKIATIQRNLTGEEKKTRDLQRNELSSEQLQDDEEEDNQLEEEIRDEDEDAMAT